MGIIFWLASFSRDFDHLDDLQEEDGKTVEEEASAAQRKALKRQGPPDFGAGTSSSTERAGKRKHTSDNRKREKTSEDREDGSPKSRRLIISSIEAQGPSHSQPPSAGLRSERHYAQPAKPRTAGQAPQEPVHHVEVAVEDASNVSKFWLFFE